jgi:hypothetical protein
MSADTDELHIKNGDLIDRSQLLELVSGPIHDNFDSITLSGSLLDYQIDESAAIMSCNIADDKTQFTIEFEWPEEFPNDKEKREESRLQDTFLRAGVAEHANINDVMERLRVQDDVILGVDTNVLWDCLLSSTLLKKIYEEPFPNWILVAVPKFVMAETENAANNTFAGAHPRAGDPVYSGRVAQRALQEIMDIRRRDPDRPGLAMITVGEINQSADIDRGNWKLDSLIRTQFQEFLRDISFHKGTFFLSQDRVNVMMSDTEGADGLYLQKPDLAAFNTGIISLKEFTKVLYELCIQFGTICIEDDETNKVLARMSVLWPGKEVNDWRDSKLMISNYSG